MFPLIQDSFQAKYLPNKEIWECSWSKNTSETIFSQSIAKVKNLFKKNSEVNLLMNLSDLTLDINKILTKLPIEGQNQFKFFPLQKAKTAILISKKQYEFLLEQKQAGYLNTYKTNGTETSYFTTRGEALKWLAKEPEPDHH